MLSTQHKQHGEKNNADDISDFAFESLWLHKCIFGLLKRGFIIDTKLELI